MAQRQRWPLITSLQKVVSLSKTLLMQNGKCSPQCHRQIQHYRSRQQLQQQQQQQQQQYRTFVDYCYRKPVVHWRLSSLSQQQSTEHCHIRSLYKCRRMTYSQHHFQKDDDDMGLESVDRKSNSFSTTKSVTSTTSSSKVSVASMEDKWQAMTKRLIGMTHNSHNNNNNNNHDTDNNDTIPYTVGSLTDAMWVEARQVLQYWMEQGNISLCWKILDRLNYELSMVIAPDSTTRHQLPAVEILNPILKLWKEDLQYHFLNQLESSGELLVEKPLWPSQVAERIRQYQKSRLVQPDKASHCIIMNATVHIQQHVPTTEGVEFVESYFRTWVHDWQESITDKRHSFPEPDSHALGTVIRAWAESDHLDGPERAEAWLKEPFVHSLGILNNPDSAMILYTSIMTAWARIGNPFKANEWMDRIRDETKITDRRCWATLIRAWATYATLHNNNSSALSQPHHFVYPKEKEDRIMAGNHAHKLIEEMTEEIRPLTGTYNVILEMWSKLAESLFVEYNDEEASRMAADRANSLLLRMKNVPPESDSETSLPNPASHYAVLSAFCRSRQPWLAEKLLDTIVQETSNGGSDSALEIQYFSVVISGWSMIDDRLDVGERGDDLFQVAKKCGLVPDSALYCACINCWAKAAEKGNATVKRKAIRRSEALIVEMKEQGIPWNSFAFSELVKVYANCNELEKAQEFLDAWLSEYETTHDPELLPAPIIFTPLLSAWARSNRPHAAIHSLELLRKMQKYNVMPNDFSYAAVINAFGSSKVEDAADIALQLFYEMQTDAGIEPSVYSWSSVIAALAKHDRVDEAEKMLEQMIQGHGARPTAFTFNAVLNGLSRSGRKDSPERAMEWLERMQRLYKENLVTEPPNRHCYNSVLACMAKSGRPGMAEEADALVQYMSNDRNLSPDVFTIHTVMNAWANKGNWSKVLSYYKLLQRRYQNTGKNAPNEVTFGTLWKAVQRAKHLTLDDKVHTMTRLTKEFAKYGVYQSREIMEGMDKLQRRLQNEKNSHS